MMAISLATVRSVTLDAAQQAAKAALSRAESGGHAVAVCITDAAGRGLVALRMDGAPWPCADVARAKAETACAFGTATHALGEALDDEHPRVAQGLVGGGHLTLVGGGVPLTAEGEVIGAIGVSGASESEDIACAEAGAAAVQFETQG